MLALLPALFLKGFYRLSVLTFVAMASTDDYHAEMRAAIAAAREDPYTDLVMTVVDWTALPLLLLWLAPCLWLAWKAENWELLGRSIRWGWAGLFFWHFWMGLVIPIFLEWTGGNGLAVSFSAPSIVPMALVGWFPGAIVSFIVCSLGIVWRWLRGTKVTRSDNLQPSS